MKQVQLTQGWQFKQRTSEVALENDLGEGWLTASVPGTTHQDLLAAGQIPDPFYGLNEKQLQWIGERDWLYRCQFEVEPTLLAAQHIALVCEGLDTFATLWLNGAQVLESDNMFLPQRIVLKEQLRQGHNELLILFESAWRRGKEREGDQSYPLWNGDSSRLFVRKAQYHYGWDWGPTFLTAGIWRPIYLQAYDTRISDLHCPAEVAADLQSATLPIRVELEDVSDDKELELNLAVYGPDGELVAQTQQRLSSALVEQRIEIAEPRLWWPYAYGEQAFYRVVAILKRGTQEIEQRELRIGLRRVQLIQRPLLDESGTSFFFEINNTPIFCGGANWIPADSFIPSVSPERYRRWLELAREGNMAMLRVWGGGFYEEDIFYDLCDELGLLVWQDFMFGCGIYPAPQWLQESVREEARANVQRLRHHPSLVIWVGNNEDYMLANSIKRYRPAEQDQSDFPARVIYEQLLPEICAAYDGTRPYWPGSPFGTQGPDVNDSATGDQHIWSIWHGMVPYQDYYKFAGRFISEFGMQSYPAMKTILASTPVDDLYPQSRTLDHHNKNVGGPARVAGYLAENFRIPGDLEGYVYITQLLQAEAMGAAVRGWRRKWLGEGREYVAGALIWQHNDCWPVTSWALIDYYLRPKPAYYVVSRELAPITLGLVWKDAETVECWGVTSLTQSLSGELELSAWTVDGELIKRERGPVDLLANQATELKSFASMQENGLIIAARLLKGDEVLARTALWPEPLKYLPQRASEISIERLGQDALEICVRRPAKGVFFTSDEDLVWSDNMLDLLPDDPQRIIARGLGAAPVNFHWLGK